MPAQEGTARSAGFIVVNQSPDVCFSPAAPIPYNVIGFLSDADNTSDAQGGDKEVRFQGFSAFNMDSRLKRCFGDTPGVGLGLGSAAVQGWCRPITPVITVKCNRKELCRHEHTQFEMNCLGPEGPGNTTGKVFYLGAMFPGPVGPNGAMPAGANKVLQANTPKEPSFLDKIKDSLKIDSIEDAVALSQRAYDLAQVDWSSPSAALGAISGMAGRAGLGGLETAINAGKTAMNIDWKDPVAALKGAASLAGTAMSIDQSMKDNFGFGLTDIAGKIWSLPNTLLGLTIGGVGAAVQGIGYGLGMTSEAPGLDFDHNGIGFTNNAFVRNNTAVTFGNAILYSPSMDPDRPLGNATVGTHEQAHTHQGEMLGPLYLPAWGLGAAIAIASGKDPMRDNFMETGPYGHDHNAF